MNRFHGQEALLIVANKYNHGRNQSTKYKEHVFIQPQQKSDIIKHKTNETVTETSKRGAKKFLHVYDVPVYNDVGSDTLSWQVHGSRSMLE